MCVRLLLPCVAWSNVVRALLAFDVHLPPFLAEIRAFNRSIPTRIGLTLYMYVWVYLVDVMILLLIGVYLISSSTGRHAPRFTLLWHLYSHRV